MRLHGKQAFTDLVRLCKVFVCFQSMWH